MKLRHHNSVNGSPIVDNSSSSTLQVRRSTYKCSSDSDY
jgi:hypothetical protein